MNPGNPDGDDEIQPLDPGGYEDPVLTFEEAIEKTMGKSLL